MLFLIKFIYKTFFLPPGVFIVFLAVFAVWLHSREKRAARVLLFVTALFYLLSTDLVGDSLIRSLEKIHPQPSAVEGDVLVMLGGGATLDTPDIDGPGNLYGSAANRLLVTARLQRRTGLPVIISSGQSYSDSGNEPEIAKRQLVGLGVPPYKIITEEKSRNTSENAQFTKQVLDLNGYKRPVLITSAFHMKRSVRNFKNMGVDVQPFPADYYTSVRPYIYPGKFVPSSDGLAKSSIAIKEYLGNAALILQ